MKVYITLCYSIYHKDIGLLCHTLRKVYIIILVPLTLKPKYTHVLMRQLYIIDTKTADYIFYKAYLANSWLNSQELSHAFTR